MTTAVQNRIWSFFGLMVFAAAATGWLRTTGAPVSFLIPGFGSISTPDVLIYGYVMVAVLLLLLHWLLRERARVLAALPPIERLPVFLNIPEHIDPSTRGGRWYLWIVFVAFALLPVLFLLPQLVMFLNGTVHHRVTELPYISGILQQLAPPGASLTDWFGDKYRFEKGPQYYVWLNPYLNIALWLACLLSAINLRRYYRSMQPPPGRPSGWMSPPAPASPVAAPSSTSATSTTIPDQPSAKSAAHHFDTTDDQDG